MKKMEAALKRWIKTGRIDENKTGKNGDLTPIKL